MTSQEDEEDHEMQKYVVDLPKVELHAHLNGCIRESTLFELAQERNVTLSSHHFDPTPHNPSLSYMYNVKPRSLQDCFEMFEDLKKCVNDKSSLMRITREALEDFAHHNVIYLELRSTPKQFKDLTKRQYIETIIHVMDQFEQYNTMSCRLIVSIDRSGSVEEALETVALAIEFHPHSRVVGVDLGGNPTKNDFRDYQEALQQARSAGLKTTVHCGEVPIPETDSNAKSYQEVQAIFQFRPDRLGHALLLPPILRDELIHKYKIPVESCPTSNVMTLELAQKTGGNLLEGLQQHPQLHYWLEQNHPLSISTDDPGVFHTTPTQELLLLARACKVSKQRLQQISINSMDQAFCSDELKATCKGIIENYNKA